MDSLSEQMHFESHANRLRLAQSEAQSAVLLNKTYPCHFWKLIFAPLLDSWDTT